MMEWLPSSADLNLIENLRSIVKMKLYESSKQYNNSSSLLCLAISTDIPDPLSPPLPIVHCFR